MEARAPLSPADAQQLADLLATRTRIAWVFSALSALATSGFALKRTDGLLAGDLRVIGVTGAVCAVVAALVWIYGWRRVIALRADLRDGHKLLLRGEISALDTQPNAYGETITHVTIAGIEVVGRAPALATWKVGQRATVEYLPRSRVAFGGSLSPD